MMKSLITVALLAIFLLATPLSMATEKITGRSSQALTPSSGGSAQSGLDDKMREDRENRPIKTDITTAPLPPLQRKVSVLIESNPSNSDITIDGVYVGSTPVQLSLKEGVHLIKVSREGFLPWSRPVKAYNGLMVSPTLVSGRSIKQDETISAESK